MTLDVPLSVLVMLVAVLLAAVALLVSWVTVGAVVERMRRRRRDRWTDQLQPQLHALAMGEAGARTPARTLARLPWREQADALAAFVANVAGDRAAVRALARHTGLLDRADRWQHSRRWHRRLHAVRVLTLVGAGHGTVPGLLADPHPEVRAQAAYWIAEHGDGDAVARVLACLEGDAALGGFVLIDGLSRCGPRASEPLLDFLARDDVAPSAALTVAASLADARFAEPADRWSRCQAPAVRAAAARLLAAVGDAAGTTRLRELLTDDDARVRAASCEGLGDLGHWPAAPDLAAALGDSAFVVRRQAGLALRRCGGTGQLYLRRGLDDDDAFAADMARQVLSLPGEVTA